MRQRSVHCQLAALVLLTGVAIAFGDSAAPAEAVERPREVAGRQAPARFICVTTCVNDPFFAEVARGARDAAALMDVQCDFVGTPAIDVPAQVEMVRKAIAQHYDGIAINIVDPTAFDGVIAEAKRQKIPVMAFNVNAQPNSRVPTVAQNLYDGGRAAAFAAAPMIPDGSRVLLTIHSDKPTPMDQRYNGVRDGLRDKDIIWETLLTGGGAQEIEQLVAARLKANPRIKTIIAAGLTDTEAAGRAVERHFKGQGYFVAGFDVSPEVLRLIRADVVTFAVDQQPYVQGFYPVVQLALASRDGIQTTSMDSGARIVRKKGADEHVRRSRELDR